MGQWQWAAKGLLTAACAAISGRGLSSGPLVLQGSGQKEASGRWRDGGEVSQLSGRALDPVHHHPSMCCPEWPFPSSGSQRPRSLKNLKRLGCTPQGPRRHGLLRGR